MTTFVKTLTFACILFLAGYNNISAQSVGINTDNSAADASALLDVKSTTQGVLVPRMSQAQRDAIASPATGLMIFQTDNTPGFYYNAGTPASKDWKAVGGSSTAAYPNIELAVTNSTIQNIPDLLGGTTTTVLTFSTTNSVNASLTGGNTWDGSVFTVGSTGGGWYQVNVQTVGVSSGGAVDNRGVVFFMDKNNTVGTSKVGAINRSNNNFNTSENVLKNANTMNVLIYLAAGDNIRFRGYSQSNSTAANTSADGSTFLNIMRVK